MDELALVNGLFGTWAGQLTFHLPDGGVYVSPSTVQGAPPIRGSGLDLEYRWEFRGNPQIGSILLWYLPERAPRGGNWAQDANWVELWQVPDDLITLNAEYKHGDTIELVGQYERWPEPDGTWRIIIRSDGQTLDMAMWSVSPTGQTDSVIEASYVRM